MAHTKLAEKQELFLQEYVTDFNASRAYQKVYGNQSRGASAASATRLLNKDKTKKRLDEILADRRGRAQVDSHYVLQYLMNASQLDINEFADIGAEGMTLKEFRNIPIELRKFITEVTQSETKAGNIIVNFKVFSKERALDLLAKHTGVAKENVEHSGSVQVHSITDLVNRHSGD